MKRILLVLFACVFALATAVPAAAGQSPAESPKVLQFGNMEAVTGPFVGTLFPDRGVPGGGLPWIISSGEGELHLDGTIEVHVRGLVLESGMNPVTSFKALVSCFDFDGNVVNVSTGEFPASSEGDSDIKDTVSELPDPCFAPIVFVTSPAGSWFAVHGALVEFETMVGNDGAFVGGEPIQGVPSAGAPWTLDTAAGSLDEDGNLEVHVRGLVLTNTGENPVAMFRGLVSCLTIESGKVVAKTVRTDPFPATVPGGDSDIAATLELPSPCFAALVFVTSPTGSFFSVTGFQS